MSKKEHTALMARIRKEDREGKAQRLAKIQRAIRLFGKDLFDFELTNIESALSPAVGRIAMDRK